jgi:hypothetical protein
MKNVLILVNVQEMQIVQPGTTEGSVLVNPDLLEIHMVLPVLQYQNQLWKIWDVKWIENVLASKLASSQTTEESAKTLALHSSLVFKMLNAKFMTVCH